MLRLIIVILVLSFVCENKVLTSQGKAEVLCVERGVDDDSMDVSPLWNAGEDKLERLEREMDFGHTYETGQGVSVLRARRSSGKINDSIHGADDEDTQYRVIGGYPIDITDLPSIVHISISPSAGWRVSCSGHLVTPSHVLTVASCLCKYSDIGKKFTIIPVNLFRLRVASANFHYGGHESGAKKICIHPRHMKNIKAFYFKDIGILTLEKKVKIDKLADIAPLHPEINYTRGHVPFKNKTCYVAGWGINSLDHDSMSDQLLIAPVTFISFTSCRFRYGSKINLHSNVCTMGNRYTCRGDSGGGLFCDNKIVGLISWRWSCTKNFPQIYARVDNIRDFIKSATRNSSTCHPLLLVLQLGLLIMFLYNYAHILRLFF